MSAIPSYESRPYATELETTVLEVGVGLERPWVLLEDTVFYPEGGGQPADTGTINAVRVVDVQRDGDAIRHYLEAPLPSGPVHVRLDWERRFDHMQQHTAQHLITAIAADELGWQTTSFHLGAEISDIELDVAELAAAELAGLEERVAAAIRAALPVRSSRVPADRLASMPGVRSRGLPAGHRGDVRLVEIESIDRNTCGGTHVASTAEIEAVKLLRTEPMRGGSRLHWVAGGRVRRRLAVHELRVARLRRIFEGADDEIADLAEAKLERARAAERRVASLQQELAGAVVERLRVEPGPLLEAHFDAADGSFLQLVLRALSAADEQRAVFLTASSDGGCFFALRAAGADEEAARRLGAEIAAILGAKGGGSAGSFQGKAASLRDRQRAVALLTDTG